MQQFSKFLNFLRNRDLYHYRLKSIPGKILGFHDKIHFLERRTRTILSRHNYGEREISNAYLIILIRIILKNLSDSQIEFINYILPYYLILCIQRGIKFKRIYVNYNSNYLFNVNNARSAIFEFIEKNKNFTVCKKFCVICNAEDCTTCANIREADAMALATLKEKD